MFTRSGANLSGRKGSCQNFTLNCYYTYSNSSSDTIKKSTKNDNWHIYVYKHWSTCFGNSTL